MVCGLWWNHFWWFDLDSRWYIPSRTHLINLSSSHDSLHVWFKRHLVILINFTMYKLIVVLSICSDILISHRHISLTFFVSIMSFFFFRLHSNKQLLPTCYGWICRGGLGLFSPHRYLLMNHLSINLFGRLFWNQFLYPWRQLIRLILWNFGGNSGLILHKHTIGHAWSLNTLVKSSNIWWCFDNISFFVVIHDLLVLMVKSRVCILT